MRAGQAVAAAGRRAPPPHEPHLPVAPQPLPPPLIARMLLLLLLMLRPHELAQGAG